jgi:histidyl-tRNA synthetase
MKTKLQAIRGMNDILPDKINYWHRLEAEIQRLCDAFGYEEIRTPVVEVTNLFQRSIGEVTDIVEKEMYTFLDRNGDSLSLRPEFTAGCVRAVLQHGLINQQPQRLWYYGPVYRYERPQKGRYRQFHHFGCEAFGYEGPDIDCELICFTDALWRALGIRDKLILQLNSLGTSAARAEHRALLVDYFRKNFDQLDADSQRRLETNPLRILDSKNPEMQSLNDQAPKILDCLDEESKVHFEQLCQWLDQCEIAYEINPRLVRGLDYYSKTVFEWMTEENRAKNNV